jgi:Tetracyclin repressor-like, C-terminal domain
MDFVLNEGRQPPSVHTFSKNLGFSEADFYKHYSSFDAVEADFWRGVFEGVRDKVVADPAWEKFRFRERVLLFAFTLVQVLLPDRSFAVFSLKRGRRTAPGKKFQDGFDSFFNELISLAVEGGEVMNRRYLRDRYTRALWMQTLFVLSFWADDSSDGFESTDEAIEKGFNLAIDLMSRSAVDNAIEYGKLLARNRIMR